MVRNRLLGFLGLLGFLRLLRLLGIGNQIGIHIAQQVQSNQALSAGHITQLGSGVGSQIVAVQLHAGTGVHSDAQFVLTHQGHGSALGGIQAGLHEAVAQRNGDVCLGVALVGHGAGVQLAVVEQDREGLHIGCAIGGHFAGHEGDASHDGAVIELAGGKPVAAAVRGIDDHTNILIVGHGGVAAHIHGTAHLDLSAVDDHSLGGTAGCVHHLGKVDVIHEAGCCGVTIHGIHNIHGGLTVLIDGGIDLAVGVTAAGVVGSTLSDDLILTGNGIDHDPCVAGLGLHISVHPVAVAGRLFRLLGNIVWIGITTDADTLSEGMLALLHGLTAFAGLPVTIFVMLPGTQVGVLAGNQLGSDILQQA